MEDVKNFYNRQQKIEVRLVDIFYWNSQRDLEATGETFWKSKMEVDSIFSEDGKMEDT